MMGLLCRYGVSVKEERVLECTQEDLDEDAYVPKKLRARSLA